MRLLLLFSVVFSAILLNSGDSHAAERQTTQPTAEQIAIWVKQLDSDVYAERENANDKLIDAGETALEAVSHAAANGGPEVVWRAVTILEKIGASGSEKTLLSVVKSLTTLATKGDKRAERISATLHYSWQMTRHTRAVAALRKMGAEITEGQAVSGLPGGSYMGTPVYSYPVGGLIPYSSPDVSVEVLRGMIKEAESVEITPTFESESYDDLDEPEPCDSEPTDEEQVEEAEQVEEVELKFGDPKDSGPRIIIGEDEIEYELKDIEGTFTFDSEDLFIAPSISRVVPYPGGMASPFAPPTMQVQRTIVIGEKWKGGDEGLKYLSDLVGFTTITVEKNKLTPAAMKHIAAMKQLTVLTLQHCSYEQSVIADFRKARPKVQVRAFGATVLGVAGNPDVSPFVLSHVQPETAAAKAGLQVGDTIVSVDGAELKDFSQLTFLVASKKIGDEITLEVRRGDKTMVRKAKLGARAEVEPAPTESPRLPTTPSYSLPPLPDVAPSPRR